MRFTGYEKNQDVSKVACLIKGGVFVDSAAEGDEVLVVTEATPFYGEAGGQVGIGAHGQLQGLGFSRNNFYLSGFKKYTPVGTGRQMAE